MEKLISSYQLFALKTFLFLFCLFVGGIACSQANSFREISKINESWKFVKGDTSRQNWQTVHLPHTWNVNDVLDDEPGYYRGTGWYKKNFTISKNCKDKEISVFFEGANQQTEVFINGKKAGEHIGGYTAFSVPITKYIHFNGRNELLVKVDNSYNENIAPLSADFTFYGGIYRDVYLVATNRIHFATSDKGSNGVYISTPHVSKENASVHIRSIVSSATNSPTKIIVTTSIIDNKGKIVAATKTTTSIASFSGKDVLQDIDFIKQPNLWSPERPYLYKAETKITNAKGKVLDVIVNPLGFRWFSFDADKGFFLNGSPYKLIGASRHQDYKGLGNAVPDSLAIEDVVLLKRMGANFLRVAHYPQDPSVMKACDSLGLLASVEIPVVNEISETDSFYNNCEQMQLEMIRQNYNHPSVILWCYMNEVLLKTHFQNNSEQQKNYIANITKLAKRLEALTRKEDPYRYTMMADHGNLSQYKNAGLLEIPMIIGWNLYSGWYGGSMDDFPLFLDRFHKEFPGKPFMVTEYGADADPRIRSAQPIRFDKSIEYTTRFHQYYFTEMMKRPYVAGAIIWNLADFNSETRTESMPHMNNKGLLQWDRTPKDPYYFYQAVLSKKPFIKILGSVQNEYGIADSNSSFCEQLIQVASNLELVSIKLNGLFQTSLNVKDGLCEWKLPLKEGVNEIVVEGKKDDQVFRDGVQTKVHLQSPCLTNAKIPFKQINIMLGSTRCFVDEKGEWWQPDQPYQKGSWGFIGGKKFKLENNGRLPYGTDKNIIGTDDDPIYQTQQTGIQQYRLDVPEGSYELTLYFAELMGGKVKQPPYNLNEDERDDKMKRRIFDVTVNGQNILHHFNIADDYGLATAVAKSVKITVNNMEGILINFKPEEGEAVLNALQVKKLD